MPHQCTGCGHVFPDGSKEMLSGCPECGGNKFQFQPDSAIDGNGAAGGSDAADGDSSGGTPSAPTDAPPEPPDPPSPGGSVAETVAGAAKSVRNIVGSGRSESPSDAAGGAADREWPDVDRADATPDQPSEDAAQAGARSATVSPEELPDHDVVDSHLSDTDAPAPPSDGADASTASARSMDASATSTASTDDAASSAAADAAASPIASADAEETGSAAVPGADDRGEESPDLSELRAELNDQFESIKIVERGQYELNLMELYDREEYIVSLMEDGRYAIEVPETWRES